MVDICGSCGKIAYLCDGVICDACDEAYWMGPEEASHVRSSIVSRRLPVIPMSDPWDII